jgi:hypothetical protein
MTLRDFENGYWYLEQLKNFAERIGIPAAKKLRKDQLERAGLDNFRNWLDLGLRPAKCDENGRASE